LKNNPSTLKVTGAFLQWSSDCGFY